ncbi:hypothetical protein ACFE04_005051 [Oxalis oulophora]
MAPSKSLIARAASLMFKVRRREPELICPTRLTPFNPHPLSDIDDQESLRYQIPLINFYKYNPAMKGKDPVNVIRNALAKNLVYYYPFAGRLREGPNRKLSVDCTAEGVLFTEADADVRLKEFGDALQPPFPCLDELLYDVPGSEEILNCPLNKYKPAKWLPSGYYGNAFANPAALSTVADLTENPLSYSVHLIKKVKMDFNEEYIRSIADFLVSRGRPHVTVTRTFVVSDLTHAGIESIDFGWRKVVYDGVARAGIGEFSIVSFYVPSKNHKDEDGILVPICLPSPVMERFVIELDTILNKN